MRIINQLKLIAALSLAGLLVSTSVLLWSLNELRSAERDIQLAGQIRVNFFQRTTFRDQYYLYREARSRQDWDASKAESDRLVQLARLQLHSPAMQRNLVDIQQYVDESASIFHRIVKNTSDLESADRKADILRELDKRLYSQLLVKGATVRDAVTALQTACAQRVEATYRQLLQIIGVLVLALGLFISALTLRIVRLVRRSLAPLHAGTKAVGAGDLSYRITVQGDDEIGDMARSINTMTALLEAQSRQKAQLEAEHLAMEEKTRELNCDFVSFLENTIDLVYFKDANSRYRFCSQTLANITHHASWRDMIGKHTLEVFPADTGRLYYEEELPIFSHGSTLTNKINPFYDADGHPGWIASSKWPLRDAAGNIVGIFGISRDISEQKRAEEKLELAAKVFSHAREGITITDAQANIVDVNSSFSRITGYSREEVLGKNPRVLSSGRQNAAFYTEMWRALLGQGYWSGEIWNRKKSGEVYAEILTISTVRDFLGQPQQYVAMFSDITPIKEHEHQLERIAHFDALTELPNRVLLADRMHQAMTHVKRLGRLLAVVFLDLDGFKAVNDRHGHRAGDQLLVGVSAHMKQCLREGDTLARLGGDEFVAVLSDLEDITDCTPLLLRLLAAASSVVPYGSVNLHVSASLGVTFYPQAEEIDADTLLRQADVAMYQAKQSGKNRYHLFDAARDKSVPTHTE